MITLLVVRRLRCSFRGDSPDAGRISNTKQQMKSTRRKGGIHAA